MKNFKLFALAFSFCTLFSAVSATAQDEQEPTVITGLSTGYLRCSYTIQGNYVGTGISTLNISVSTGLNLDITLLTGGSYIQPIGVVFPSNNSQPVTVTITSPGSSQAGIRVKVNNTIVCEPGNTRIVRFTLNNTCGFN